MRTTFTLIALPETTHKNVEPGTLGVHGGQPAETQFFMEPPNDPTDVPEKLAVLLAWGDSLLKHSFSWSPRMTLLTSLKNWQFC